MSIFSIFRNWYLSGNQKPAEIVDSHNLVENEISYDETGVHRKMKNGKTEYIRWDELNEVVIITTDEGPFVDDVFWVLKGESGGCVAPSEALGTNELITRLQQLPEFDNNSVISAMQSTSNAEFLCWKRKTTKTKPDFQYKSIIANITLYKTQDGGRNSPFNEGYCPHLRCNGDGEYLGVRIINQKTWVSPGESTVVEIGLMYYPDVNYSELIINAEFAIVEGTKVIGTGKVVRGFNDE